MKKISILSLTLILTCCGVSVKQFTQFQQETQAGFENLNRSLSDMESELSNLKTELSKHEIEQEKSDEYYIGSITELTGRYVELDSRYSELTANLDSRFNIMDSAIQIINKKISVLDKLKTEETFIRNEIDKHIVSFDEIDAYVINLEAADDVSVSELVKLITRPAETDLEKVRALFVWIAYNIAYDTDYKIVDAENCFKSRKGICNAYAELFNEFCREAGLESKKISGFSKDIYYNFEYTTKETGHAWNAVKIDDKWILVDPTWGAGYVDGNNFVPKIKSWWFNTDPSLFVFTHIPRNPDEQMLENPIGDTVFWSLPPITPNIGMMGIDPGELLAHFIENPNTLFPKIFSFETMFKIIEMPKNRNIKNGEEYEFAFALPDKVKIAISNNDQWHTNFTETGNKHSIKITPQTGSLKVAICNPDIDKNKYYTAFQYTVE